MGRLSWPESLQLFHIKIKVQDQIIFLLVINADLFTGTASDYHHNLGIKCIFLKSRHSYGQGWDLLARYTPGEGSFPHPTQHGYVVISHLERHKLTFKETVFNLNLLGTKASKMTSNGSKDGVGVRVVINTIPCVGHLSVHNTADTGHRPCYM